MRTNSHELCESITERIVSWIIAQQCAKSVWRRGCNLNRPCHPKTDPSFPPLIFGQISESGVQLITARYYCGSDINLSLRVQPNFPRACRDRAPYRSSVNKSTYEDAWFSTRERAAVSIDISRFIRDRVFCIANYESKRTSYVCYRLRWIR